MTRRLILAALALFAFFALESCGVSRLAGPVNDSRTFTATQFKKKNNNQKPVPVVQNEPTTVPNEPGTDEQPIERSH